MTYEIPDRVLELSKKGFRKSGSPLWDDRAVQVIPNTGRTLAEEHEAEKQALLGKQYSRTV